MSSIVRGAEGALQFEHGDGMPFGHELAAAYETMSLDRINEEVTNLKGALTTFLSDKHTAHVADSINANHLMGPVANIGGKVVTWLARASGDDLLDFSVANARHHAGQSQQLRDMELLLRASMLERGEWLHQIGYLPLHASRVYERANAAVHTIRRMDFFEAGAMAAGGYYELGSGTITLADQPLTPMGGPTTVHYDTVIHEFTHAAGDLTGGFVTLDAPPHDLSMAEETVASHTTQVSDRMPDPMPDVLDPDARGEVVQGTYVDVRKLVSVLAKNATRTLCVGDFTEAFFTPPSMGVYARIHVQSRLHAAVRELLPDYRTTGLLQFSQDYNERYAANAAAEWVDAQIRMATGMAAHQVPSGIPPPVTDKAVISNLVWD